MIRKVLLSSAVAMLLLAGFLATGCSSSSDQSPSALRGDDANAQKAAYLQGHNKAYGYYGPR
ncbi:MAG: hypothetical protein ACTHN5_06300 [Phycisphaerae bacterium]